VSESNFPLSELAPAPQETKPTWRGWIHTGVLPFVVLGGIILLIFADGWLAKTAAAIYFASSVLLFGNSALYHRFNWRPVIKLILKRIDHANIFLIIVWNHEAVQPYTISKYENESTEWQSGQYYANYPKALDAFLEKVKVERNKIGPQ
jgi:hypothetical protein